MTDLVLKLDLNSDAWTIPEGRLYRQAAGVNVDYAWEVIRRAIDAAETEARETFGEAIDTEGFTEPEGWTPLSVLNIDPDYLLAMYWIRARRDDHELTYDAFAECVPYGDLASSFWQAMSDAVEAAAAPLVAPNREQRRKTGPRSKPASRSRTSTAGRSKTSTASPSPSSAPQSATETST